MANPSGIHATLRVRDLMTAKVFALAPGDDLATLRDLLEERHIRHAPVVDVDGELVGVVSHRDLLRAGLIEQVDVPPFVTDEVLRRTTVADIMTTDVETIDPEADVREAAQILYDNKIGCLPVVEGSRLVGILTEADFVRLMAQGQ